MINKIEYQKYKDKINTYMFVSVYVQREIIKNEL